MLRNRFNVSGQTLIVSVIATTLLYVLFSVVQPIGSALGAALLQSVTGANTTPPYLNYQGTLRDAEGKPISGVHKLTFRIYGDVTAPTPQALWMETHNEVTVRDGHFSVLLGDSTPISTTIFKSPDRFIGITLDTLDEMVPRQRFASVPYASNADMLDGLQAQDFALAGHVHNRLSAADGTPNDAIVVNNDGNVGIGTTTPERRLQVTGDGIRVQNADRAIDLRADLGAVDLLAPNTDLYISSQGGNRNVILNHTGGRVGINTPAPGATLDLNGDAHIQGVIRMGSAYLPPVFIRRYSDLGADSTTLVEGISASLYDCTTGSWAINMDVDENDAGPYMMWTYVEGDSWLLRTRHWTDKAEQNNVDVICFLRNAISVYDGDRYDAAYN